MIQMCLKMAEVPDGNGEVLNQLKSEPPAFARHVHGHIDWILRDGGAKSRYALGRLAGLKPWEAMIYRAQSHNRHSQCALYLYGRARVNEYLCKPGHAP